MGRCDKSIGKKGFEDGYKTMSLFPEASKKGVEEEGGAQCMLKNRMQPS